MYMYIVPTVSMRIISSTVLPFLCCVSLHLPPPQIASRVLDLVMRELFEFRFMQTDPNWSNFFYNTEEDRVSRKGNTFCEIECTVDNLNKQDTFVCPGPYLSHGLATLYRMANKLLTYVDFCTKFQFNIHPLCER